jgi:uncharacterized membrane-anchored protein
MKNKYIIIIFIIVVISQYFVVAKLIGGQEEIHTNGKEYLFKTTPVDPYNPFKGNYVKLRYEIETLNVTKPSLWKRKDVVFIELTQDSLGFAKVNAIFKEKPMKVDFVTAKVGYVNKSKGTINIDLPFDRIYLNADKAKELEYKFEDINKDSTKIAYAKVKLKNGKGAISQLIIDNAKVYDFND